MSEITELGARMQTLSIVESEIVAVYEVIDSRGVVLGGTGSIRISFAALDAIDQGLGGTGRLTNAQRLDLAAKFVRPLIVGQFERVENVAVHVDGGVVASSIAAQFVQAPAREGR